MHVSTNSSTIIHSLLSGAIYTLIFSSCLSEPDKDCPPAHRITLNIKDKNYINAYEVSQISPKNESLPFRVYVENISYQLRDLQSGQILMDTPASPVITDQPSQIIDVTGIPEGQYILTVLGNTDETTLPGKANIALHANNQERTDSYLAHDTLTFSAMTTSHTLSLSRTKGLLLILVENSPDSLTRVDEKITRVALHVTPSAVYDGENSVNKSFIGPISPGVPLQTWIAPTVPAKKSTLQFSLFAHNKTKPYSILPDIELSIKRNEISVIKITFALNGIEIWIYLYGSWQKLHNLDITTD